MKIPFVPPPSQSGQRPPRVQHHRKRRQDEWHLIDPFQGQHHSRHQIGAAPHRLRYDHIRSRLSVEPPNCSNQLVETTAKAASGNLLHARFSTRRQANSERKSRRIGVHQTLSLVIRHQSCLDVILLQPTRQMTDQCRLPRPQKSSDEHEAPCYFNPLRKYFCRCHRKVLPSLPPPSVKHQIVNFATT